MNSRQIRQVVEQAVESVTDPEAAGTFLKVQVKRNGNFVIDRRYEKRTDLMLRDWVVQVATAVGNALGRTYTVGEHSDRWCGWVSDEVWFRVELQA